MNKTYYQDCFSTSDITLCATLCSYGYNIESIDKSNPSKAEFLIKRDDALDELIMSYFSRCLKVEPMAFSNNLRAIKTQIYHT